jgi:hypothetical protein
MPANRDKQGRFPPGQSGNPTGRPKGLADMIAQAREYTPLALRTLVELASQRKHLPTAKAAADSLWDRGWGKPTQPIDGDAAGGPVRLVVRWERDGE